MTILFFLFAFSALVLIHEFGHYLAARAFGIKTEEFGIGFPPRIIGIVRDRGRWKCVGPRDRAKYAHTIWSLNWFLFGGFVRIKGEQADGIHDPDSIHAKPIWQRLIVILAGVLMNWMLAIALFTAVFAVGTSVFFDSLPQGAHVKNRRIILTQTLPGSPAETAGLKNGDAILSIEETQVADAADARRLIGQRGIQTTAIRVRRDSQELLFSVTPAYLQEMQKTGIGVSLEEFGTVSFPLHLAALQGLLTTAATTQAIVGALGNVLTQLFVGNVPQDLSGPVGIAVFAHRIATQGFAPFVQFTALLSVNLAVINVLPIPALDGGRALFLVIEKLRRRPLSRTFEIGIHNVAFVLLLLIILLVTARDVTRLLNGAS